MEIGMVYDNDKFVFKDKINNLIPKLKEEFLLSHGLDTTNIPLYSEYIGNSLDPHGKWKMLVIKIMGEWEAGNLSKYPTLTNLVKDFGDVCRSAGYSILDAGGVVPIHTDTEEGHENYVICHVPLIVPDGDIGFLEGDVEGKWVEGSCFLLDIETPHSIWNRTSQPRVVVLLELLKEVSYAV
jgi:aspartyl/asparaginyl beta-hydroxylase (cupin superfamily)